MAFLIRRSPAAPPLDGAWDDAAWQAAETAEIACFRPESSDHRPDTRLKLLYDDTGISGLFQVRDRYVRSVHTDFQDRVCEDSCVEFFIQPAGVSGYFNFEMNCGGTLLVFHVRDWTRGPGGLADFQPLTEAETAGVRVVSSLPKVNEPELAGPTLWQLGFFIPFALFRTCCDRPAPVAGEVWRGNFYKCGDLTSHPHWASWQPVSAFNFHLPECFGELRFG